MRERIKKLLSRRRKEKRLSDRIYLILRILVLLCMVLQLFRREYGNALLCVLSLVLFTLPILFQATFRVKLPGVLEIIIYLFIFAAEICGEIFNFYGTVPNWDTMLHTINGFIYAGIGFGMIALLNENSKKLKLSPIYVALVSFTFSMTIGVCWEFFEYGADTFMRTDMQKDTVVTSISTVSLNPKQENKAVQIDGIDRTVLYDEDGNELAVIEGGYLDIGLIDTMKDMLVNLVGAAVFSVFGFFYEQNHEKYRFAENFIPTKFTEDE